jgi:hypothetical protein
MHPVDKMFRVIVVGGVALTAATSPAAVGCGGATTSPANAHDAGHDAGFPMETAPAPDAFPTETAQLYDAFPTEGPAVIDTGVTGFDAFPTEGVIGFDAFPTEGPPPLFDAGATTDAKAKTDGGHSSDGGP